MTKGLPYRQIHPQLWHDDWFIDLEPDAKLLFIYLFSNPNTRLCGLYPLSVKVAAFETGLDRSQVERLLTEFERAGKILHDGGWVLVVNFLRHNNNCQSWQQRKGLMNEYNRLPAGPLRDRLGETLSDMGIQDDRVSIPSDRVCIVTDIQEQEQEQKSILHGASGNGNGVGADAPPAPSPAPKKTRKPPVRTEADTRLMHAFCVATGFDVPPKVQDANWWYSTLRELPAMVDDDIGRATTLIGDTVRHMRSGKEPLTITSPKSIIGMARSLAKAKPRGYDL